MSTQASDKPSMALFWGCFIALITTAFAFITRAFLVNDPNLWPAAFGLDGVQAQQLFGAGIWPFAISIILFSLIIDRVGYKTAMWFSFICYAGYAALALKAHGIIAADPTAKALLINTSTGVLSFSASATAPWKPISILSSPRCSTRTRASGSISSTLVGQAAS